MDEFSTPKPVADSAPGTPLMRQYAAIKKEHPNALLFFRLGDFYELFFEDAVVAAKELQITLTSRNKEKGIAVPMCGVPYHAAEGYIAKLIKKGYKVAICDQMEDPRLAKKLVKRAVTRVVTPGTAADASLSSDENNFLAAVARLDSGKLGASVAGFAVLDLSFGYYIEISKANQQLAPPDYAIPLVENHFGVLSLEGFGLAGRPAAAAAAGAILHYVRSTQRGALEHVDRIGFYERQNCLVLDAVTVRNLELVEPLFAGSGDAVTLFRAIDHSLTPMGKRLLRAWMLRPSIEPAEINARLDAVEEQVRATVEREELRRALDGVLDIERLLSRITLETANPRDLLALAASLARLPGIREALGRFKSVRLRSLLALVDDLADLRARIENTLVEEPPLTLADGGVIRSAIDVELDELRTLSRSSKQYLAQIEERERQRTGIASLKVKFNSIFGYYIEISKANQQLAPPDYERKQTLVNAERFTTPELKQYEAKILDAQEKIVEIERRLFAELRAAIAGEAKRIRQTALAVAQVDVLAGLAYLAANNNYCRPKFVEGGEIEIREGRHPVVERPELTGSNDRFVPNDLYLNATSDTILVLTGPNMGGKSTYLRQAALILILAQMGSFVPAREARLSVVDRIFTRIGASDNLARGRSTFMVEMTETAAILNTATPNSLILLDEVGRGTATYDGLAIAWAAIEYIHARTRAKTLFATHYHELTELADQLSGVKNYHVSVKEGAGGIVFLRKVEPGAADRSYGIEVAKLAGLPPEVIARAREVLAEHESAEHRLTSELASDELQPSSVQLTMFTPLSQKIVEQLREADLDRLTPLEALNLLHALKQQVK
ncbi:MAG: DNA mismatch repair protein MutS [Acidobacteriia bacterium]|nr:DNA mismatch repair protein MutS [Terriglobia bacterium]